MYFSRPSDTAWNLFILALFTQRRRIISGAVVHQFSAYDNSHRAKHLCLKDELLCNSHREPALWLLQRDDGTSHDDDAGVFSRCFPGVLPLNLNPRTIYNHMDAVIMCCDWDPDSLNILESSVFHTNLLWWHEGYYYVIHQIPTTPPWVRAQGPILKVNYYLQNKKDTQVCSLREGEKWSSMITYKFYY